MEKNQQDLNGPDPSKFCGDGSCGCRCGGLVEVKEDFFKEKTLEIGSSTDKERQG